jgi:hypothetical protein
VRLALMWAWWVIAADGGLKVVRARERLVASGNFDWMKDSSEVGVKAVGLVEVLGALGGRDAGAVLAVVET